MNWSILFILSMVSLKTLANITNDDFNYSIKINESGHFQMQVNQKYPSEMDLSQIVTDLVLNENLQRDIDSSIVNINGIDQVSNKASEVGIHHYKTYTKVEYLGFQGLITSTCYLSVQKKQVENHCKIVDSSVPIIGEIFVSGSSDVICHKKENFNSCALTVQGLPRGVHLILLKRTPERLAVSGTAQTLENFFKTYLYITTGDFNSIQTEYFYRKNISNYWEQMLRFLKNSQNLNTNLLAQSSEHQIIIKVLQD